MTAPAPQCVRGCTKPGRLDNDGERGEPTPRPATDGLLCAKCSERLKGWLDGILLDIATLDTSIVRTGEGGSHGKISHSPALSRLEVLALTDRRTFPMSRPDPETGEQHEDGIIDVRGEICSWAQMFADEQHIEEPIATVVQAVKMLTAWWSTLVEQPWVDEMWAKMRDIQRLLDSAHDRPRPKPIGHCNGSGEKACGRALYAREGTRQIHCPDCGRHYDGLELIRLADNREQAEGVLQ